MILRPSPRMLFTLLALLLAIPLACQAANWQTWSPDDHAFTISLPGTPKPEDVNGIHLVSTQSGKENFAVLYTDRPSQPATPQEASDLIGRAAQAYVDQIKGKVLSQHDLTLGTYRGRELEVQGEDTRLLRIILVKKRVYQLMAIRPNGTPAANAQRFMKSFKLSK